ncbi:MAG: HAMP domain-containing sensor histidine kinase [Spirochaetales bacterium]|nr:HAMP domain-containing sensor histidine kinase [Spirochaetales bacterium]
MNRLKYAVFTILVLALTASGNILITRFFADELAGDVNRERENLQTTVFRIYAREYQRLSILIHSLQQMTIEDSEELDSALDELLHLYGDRGQIPYLIKTASFQKEYSLADSTVIPPVNQSEETIPGLDHPLNPGQFSIRTDERSGKSYLYYRPDTTEEILIACELNKQMMEEYYIKPALEESLAQYTLEWKMLNREEFKTDIAKQKSGNYPFKPFQTLLRKDHGEHIKLILPLPDHLNSRRPFIPGEEKEDSPSPDPEDNFVRGDRFLFPADPDGIPFPEDSRSLVIGGKGLPYYGSLEKRTALNWLMSQLIFLGIILTFLQLVLQLKRTKEIRSREKEFVASMTHELRTPLTVIQSAADNLSKGIVSEDRVIRYGKMMKDQTRRLSTMIEEILLFSSLEGKEIRKIPAVEMNLTGLVADMKARFTDMAAEQNTGISWDVEGLPSSVYSYPEETGLILSNLISNAVNHSHPSKKTTELKETAGVLKGEEALPDIRVSIRYLVSGKLRLTVEDRGPGIPIPEQRKIFDPFYRSLISREQQTRGSGLGLFIARKKAQLIKGSLTLESPYKLLNGEKIRGCRFILDVPAQIINREENS